MSESKAQGVKAGGSKITQTSKVTMKEMGGYKLGDLVYVLGMRCTIRWLGETEFKEGEWVGVELFLPKGRNDGTVQGKRYFDCKPNCGMFTRIEIVSKTPKSIRELKKLAKKSPTTDEKPIVDVNADVDADADADVKSPKEDEIKDFAPINMDFKEGEPVPYSEVQELCARIKHLEAARAKDRENSSITEKDIENAKKFNAIYPRLNAQFKQRLEENTKLKSDKEALESELKYIKEEREMDLGLIKQLEDALDESQEVIKNYEQKLMSMNDDNEFKIAAQSIPESDLVPDTPDREGYPIKALREIKEKDAQIEKAKDIIRRFRDSKFDMEYRLRQEIKVLEEKVAVSNDGKEEIVTLKKQLADAQGTIRILDDNLESLKTVKETFDTLSQSNIELRDKVKFLSKENDELEASTAINQELRTKDRERLVKALDEIDVMKADLDDCYEALEALNEEVIERDAHITEYRQYILTLKEDINELQEVLSSQQSEAITLRSETDKMLGLNLSLQNMVFKSKAKAVDMELKKIEANEASIHLKCIIPYLPKSFYENETDSLNFFLQLLRVYSKVELCGRQVCASHPITSIDTLIGGSGNDVMSLNTIVTHNFEFKHRLNQLNLILKSFISHVKSCSVPQYLSISRLSQDLTNIEGTVDTLLDEAKQELLVPSNHMSNIEKVVDNATYLRESYVTPNATHPLVKSSQALETLIALFNSQDLILSKMALINRSITSPTELDLFSKISDDERTLVNSDLLRPLNELMKVIFSFKSTLGSIQRFIDEKVDESTMIRSELQDIIISQYQNNEKFVKYACKVSSSIISYIKDTSMNDENLTFDGLKQTLIRASKESGFESDSEVLFDEQKQFFSSLVDQFKELQSVVTKDNKLTKLEITSPWEVRAKQISKELLESDVTEKKMNSLQSENKTLFASNRKNLELLSDKDLEVEFLKFRNNELTEKLEEFNTISTQLKEANEKEVLYNQEIERIYGEKKKLEQDVVKFKELAENLTVETKEDDGTTVHNNEAPEDINKNVNSDMLFQVTADLVANQRIGNIGHLVKIISEEVKYIKAADFTKSHDLVELNSYSNANQEELNDIAVANDFGDILAEEITDYFVNGGNSLLSSTVSDKLEREDDLSKKINEFKILTTKFTSASKFLDSSEQ